MRKTFPCGHVGKGIYCHRCNAREKLMAVRVAARIESSGKVAMAEALMGISCEGLPLLVVERAVKIVESMQSGVGYGQFKGKRLVYRDRNVISIPVGYSHRLMCRKGIDGKLEVLSLTSHEEYNKSHKEV